MKLSKEKIRSILKLELNVKYSIKSITPDTEVMNKKIFIKVIEQLIKIEDRRDFMIDEMGIDMTLYEEQFFSVIEDLFKLIFTQSQLGYIQMYLYQLVPDKDWDGTITLEVGAEEIEVAFKSPKDVWEVIQRYK
tara:strand:- start:1281 stop:1682 length:402 start_codon:yes stop_codon:yes gene_type:complete